MNLRMRSWCSIALLLGGLCVSGTSLHAQHPVDGVERMFSNLRPSGQPVIPVFDGWYQKADGTYDLCFGYFNLNTKEALDIPLGPANIVEPEQFDGMQPTHFMPVPPPPNLYRRYFCTFAVNVPAHFPKTERVVWTLEVGGRPYSVPGHLGSINYRIQELSARDAGRASVAPVIRFLPDGPEGRGRSGVTGPPLKAGVGRPLPLSLSVTGPPAESEAPVMDLVDDEERPFILNGKKRIWWVIWAKHQGPGEVTFDPQGIDIWEGEATAATTATFSAPGEYVLRVQAIDNPGENGSYQFHCCFTNGYVKVTVSN